MSVATTIQAWIDFLGVSPFSISAYKRLPPLPYTGNFPFISIWPGTQNTQRFSATERQRTGLYRLEYINEFGILNPDTSVVDLLAAADTFSELLESTLNSSLANKTLNFNILSAGEGRGITTGYDSVRIIREIYDQPLYGIPIDVEVKEIFGG